MALAILHSVACSFPFTTSLYVVLFNEAYLPLSIFPIFPIRTFFRRPRYRISAPTMSNLYPNGTRIDPNSCVAPIPGIVGSYGYNPSEAAGITFCALFGVSMVLHLYTTIRYRVWWQSVFAIGALSNHPLYHDGTNTYLYYSGAHRLGRPPLVLRVSLPRQPLPNANHHPNNRYAPPSP